MAMEQEKRRLVYYSLVRERADIINSINKKVKAILNRKQRIRLRLEQLDQRCEQLQIKLEQARDEEITGRVTLD